MESISSYGVAALLGGAAFAGIMAAVGGFESGGYTGNLGTSTPAGIVHGREFVMSAPATASIGVDALEAMNETGTMPAGGGREQRIVIVDDARTASDLQNDPEFENVVVSLMGRNAWRIRG
jgi:lambda family phage tail tape measure protein